MIELNCRFCNNVFDVHPSRYKRSKVKYCSMDCLRKASETKEFNCVQCGIKFKKFFSRIKNGRFKFCSNKCRISYSKRNSFIIRCKICKSKILNTVNNPRQYCSNKCKGIASRGKRLSIKTEFKKGQIKSKKGYKFKKGVLHLNWKGGKTKDGYGYISIYKPDHPRCTKRNYVFEHRLVMEKNLKRFLNSNEIVHHINGNKIDNRLKNLVLTTRHEHPSFHRRTK